MKSKYKIIRAVTVANSLGFVEPMIPHLKELYEVQLLSSPGEKLDRLCNEHDVQGHAVYMYRRMSPFKDLKSLVQLIKIFRKEKPYMVHSMTPKAGMLCMLAAWITRVPRRVHTFTGLVWPTAKGLNKRLLIFTDWVTCACATHVVPEGKGVMDDLKAYVTSKPMKVLGYGNVRGVDMLRFSRRPEIMEQARIIKKENLFTFIFVGRIVGDKGINELIEAFVLLNKKNKDIRLLLIGNFEEELDPIKSETKETITKSPFIEYIGPKYGDDLISYYAASDCFVFPSYREGFPNCVMEAGAMGLPSIVTDINGSREIIEDGVNGLIVPSKNITSLFEAMEKVVIDKEKTAFMASNSRKMIETRFEKSFVQKCLYDFYKEVM